MLEYRYQPGLKRIEVEGEPETGLRFKFDNEASAARFMFLRGLLCRLNPGNTDLRIDGCDVVERWDV